MAQKLYVGNLPFTCTTDEMRDLFEQHGTVTDVHLPTDRETGRPRGFGFVEMDDAGAEAAIAALDGANFGGRPLRVNAARPREEGGSGGGAGGGRGGSRGGSGGGRGGSGGGGRW